MKEIQQIGSEGKVEKKEEEEVMRRKSWKRR